jgi:hypothetical protein
VRARGSRSVAAYFCFREQSQEKREEAYDLLAPVYKVYNWFTEGFDTADFKEVKALLDALS